MPIQDFLRNNSQGLTQAGIGILSGRNPQEQFAMGAQGFMQGQQANKTAQWLEQNATPEIAQAVKMGAISPGDGFKLMFESKTKKPANLLTVGKNIYNSDTGEWISAPAGIGGDDEEWGLNPVWGVNEAGEQVLGQLSKSGKFKPLDTGDFKPTPTIQNLDLGTSILSQNSRTGAPVAVNTKDLSGAAAQTAGGKVQGETQATAQVNLGGAKQSVDRINMLINDLKNDPGLDRVLGPIDSRTPNLSADAVRAQSKIDQIGGQAFLEARQLLKGGGAITDFESARAEAAYARLSQAQDPRDFKQALDEFNQAVQDGYRKLERQAMGSPMPNGTSKRRVYNPATGNLE